jgi:hypothetical protein
MKLLAFPYLDALATALSHPSSDGGSSLRVALATFSLKPDRAHRELEARLSSKMDAEETVRRARSSSIASMLEAAPCASPASAAGADEADFFAPLAPTPARTIARKTLVALIATLNENFADYDFECVHSGRARAARSRVNAPSRPRPPPVTQEITLVRL